MVIFLNPVFHSFQQVSTIKNHKENKELQQLYENNYVYFFFWFLNAVGLTALNFPL